MLFRSGLWLFDRETNRGKKIHFKVSGLQNLSPLYIRAMAETDDHTLWLGTANYGICKVINENELQTGYEKKIHRETVLPQPGGGFFKVTELRGFVLIVHCEVLLVSKKISRSILKCSGRVMD